MLCCFTSGRKGVRHKDLEPLALITKLDESPIQPEFPSQRVQSPIQLERAQSPAQRSKSPTERAQTPPHLAGPPDLINNLPYELLCSIFAVVATIEPPSCCTIITLYSPRPSGRTENLGFLRLSEVCRRFCAVLASMPNLWAAIVCNETLLFAPPRSQQAPLTIFISNTRPTPGEEEDAPDLPRKHLVALAAEHAVRVRSLTARMLEVNEHNTIFEKPLPLLEHFNLQYCDESATSNPNNACIDAPILRRAKLVIFTEESLSLFLGNGPGVTLKLPALRSLEIYIDVRCASSPLKLGWLVGVLQSSLLIEDLKITFETLDSEIHWKTIFAGRKVQLKHLKSLNLTGALDTNMRGFYKRICSTPPSRCLINLTHELEDDEIDWVAQSSLQLLGAFGPLLQHPTHDALLVHVNILALQVGVFPSLKNPVDYSPELLDDVPEMFKLSIPPSHFPAICISIARIIMTAVKNNNIKQVVVDSPGLNALPSIVQPVIMACAAATELVVRHSVGYGRHASGFPIFTSSDLLPVLNTLFFRSAYQPATRDRESWWEGLVAWLEYRASTGSRIRRMHLQGTMSSSGRDEGEDADAMVLRRLSKLVDELHDERVVRE